MATCFSFGCGKRKTEKREGCGKNEERKAWLVILNNNDSSVRGIGFLNTYRFEEIIWSTLNSWRPQWFICKRDSFSYHMYTCIMYNYIACIHVYMAHMYLCSQSLLRVLFRATQNLTTSTAAPPHFATSTALRTFSVGWLGTLSDDSHYDSSNMEGNRRVGQREGGKGSFKLGRLHGPKEPDSVTLECEATEIQPLGIVYIHTTSFLISSLSSQGPQSSSGPRFPLGFRV